MTRLDDLEFVEPLDRASWRRWLAENHAASPGVWLAVGKKGNRVTTLTYDDAVEEALCFGWIDSTVHALDADRFRQLFTPRKRGSVWAKSNKVRVERLIREGLMQPAGLEVIDAAIADGSWTRFDDVEALVIPEDLRAALSDSPAARAHYDAFPESVRKQILYWIASARGTSTRVRRIAATVDSASRGVPPT